MQTAAVGICTLFSDESWGAVWKDTAQTEKATTDCSTRPIGGDIFHYVNGINAHTIMVAERGSVKQFPLPWNSTYKYYEVVGLHIILYSFERSRGHISPPSHPGNVPFSGLEPNFSNQGKLIYFFRIKIKQLKYIIIGYNIVWFYLTNYLYIMYWILN